jgi:hypothetical protein
VRNLKKDAVRNLASEDPDLVGARNNGIVPATDQISLYAVAEEVFEHPKWVKGYRVVLQHKFADRVAAIEIAF